MIKIKKIKRKETKSYILKKQTKLISNFLGITEKRKGKKRAANANHQLVDDTCYTT